MIHQKIMQRRRKWKILSLFYCDDIQNIIIMYTHIEIDRAIARRI